MPEKKYPLSVTEGKTHEYKFWKNKPVTKFDENPLFSKSKGKLSNRKVYASDTPIGLPTGMEWRVTDSNADVTEFTKVVNFLNSNYKTSAIGNMSLTVDYVRWSIGTNGFFVNIENNNGEIVGVAGASVHKTTVFDRTENFGRVQFLCSLPLYRKKNIAFTLIDEITRRLVKLGVNQGYFFTNRCVPSPTCQIRQYNRPINYINLQKNGVVDVGGDPTIVQHKFKLGDALTAKYTEINNSNIDEYIGTITQLYRKYTKRFNIHNVYTESELKNILSADFVRTYVISDNTYPDTVVDFVSFYILNNGTDKCTDKCTDKQNIVQSATMFLHSCNELAGDRIVNDILKIAKSHNIDVFNTNDMSCIGSVLMTQELSLDENSDAESYDHVYEHRFIKDSDTLFLNFFNWECPIVKSKQVFLCPGTF